MTNDRTTPNLTAARSITKGRALEGFLTRWGLGLSLLLLGLAVPLSLAAGAYRGEVSARTWLEVAAILILAVAFAAPWLISSWWYTSSLPAWVPPLAYLVVGVGPVLLILGGFERAGQFVYVEVFRFFHTPDVFGDLVNVTGAWECGLTTAGEANACDPFGRPYIYPSALLVVGRTGADSSWLTALGLALAVGVALALWVLAKRSTSSGRMVLTLMGISPTFILLTERANIEAILLPMFLAALWVGGKQLAPALFGLVVLLLAAFTKFLPLIAVIATPIAAPSQKLIRWVFASALFLFGVWVMLPDLGQIEAPSYLATSFGLPNLLALMAGEASPTFAVNWLVWAWVVVAGVIAVATGWCWRTSANFKVRGRFYPERAIAIAGVSVVGVAFVGFSSFDYRLILLALTVPLVNKLLNRENRFAVNARFAAGVLVILALIPLSLPAPLITSSLTLLALGVLFGWGLSDVARAIRDRGLNQVG
jgi:hypothetical protein